MSKKITILCCFALSSTIATAETEGLQQAKSFTNIYGSLCLKNLHNLDGLRQTLKGMPKLPPDQAAHFLAGYTGDAWPVPDKYGKFVLAIPTGKNLCAVHGHRVDTKAVKKQFIQLLSSAPSPMVVKQVTNRQRQTNSNGLTETIAYEWSTPHNPRTMLFTLTTASSETAELQVLGSAALIDK